MLAIECFSAMDAGNLWFLPIHDSSAMGGLIRHQAGSAARGGRRIVKRGFSGWDSITPTVG
jgi:hypothetical protein